MLTCPQVATPWDEMPRAAVGLSLEWNLARMHRPGARPQGNSVTPGCPSCGRLWEPSGGRAFLKLKGGIYVDLC